MLYDLPVQIIDKAEKGVANLITEGRPDANPSIVWNWSVVASEGGIELEIFQGNFKSSVWDVSTDSLPVNEKKFSLLPVNILWKITVSIIAKMTSSNKSRCRLYIGS